MKHLWFGAVTALGIFSVLFQAAASDALVVITNDSSSIGKIVIVSPQAGDSTTANGTALINALNSIAATPAEPYLLKLGPGIYDVQDTSVLMKEYVDIEGSGEKTTTIKGAISGDTALPASGTVQGANNAELRFLTVENMGTGTSTAAIFNSSSSPSILHVTATAMGGTNNYGIYCTDSSPKITDVTVTAQAGAGTTAGVYNSHGYPVMTNVVVTGSGVSGGGATYGVYHDLYNLTMTNVTVTAGGEAGSSYGIYNNNGGVTISHSMIDALTIIFNGGTALTRVYYTQLKGVTLDNSSGGSLGCKYDIFDGAPFDENCLPLP